VVVDLNKESAQATADELTSIYGQGIGVAGTGISGCGPAIGLSCDITNREAIQTMLNETLIAYGGIDNVIVTAGLFAAPDKDGNFDDKMWDLSFAINVIGQAKVAEEAGKIFNSQGLRGSMVLTTSVNGVVSKKGSVAYDTSKAAANHLIREMAVELAPLVRVNGLAPATVVKGSTMFPKDRVMASLKKYDIEFNESEDADALRDKLSCFYASRTLTNNPITPEDQAEAAYLLLSNRLSKTTGQILSVDGGLSDAFLR